MDRKSVEELEARFAEIIQNPPYPVSEMLELIAAVTPAKGEEWTLAALKALVDAGDFAGTFAVVQARAEMLDAKIRGAGIRDMLRKATKDRLVQAFVDAAGFGVRPLKEALARLARLRSYTPGTFVLSDAWGLGVVKELDDFYRRIIVDFRARPRHQLTFDAACETLSIPKEDHILVTQRADPAAVEKMMKEQPGEFVKAMLSSFGDMPVTRLEELCAQHGFVKAANWKKFWEGARAALRADKCVDIPTRRADALHLKATAETYGEDWFGAFMKIRDPKSILSSVRELEAIQKSRPLDEASLAKIAERLVFALKGAKGVDDALYARIAFCLSDLKLAPESVSKARAYLWSPLVSGEARYLAAARTLPARETGALVAFMTAEDRETTKKNLFAVLPQMCFPLLSETLAFFQTDADCEDAVAQLLRHPSAPATLVTLILGRYESFKHWAKLPPLVVILTHAIALGEGRQSGETLRMQNMIRRLFADQKWLEEIFMQLAPADQALFFERFQASIAWDPATHHMIVVRMTHIVPELASRQVKKVAVEKIARITSLRSYAERQAAYEHLVKVEIPENTKKIEFAKSYGDLSENAEYQYAKDEQRALMQKESILQKDLNEVKAVDFADVAISGVVCPGSRVAIVAADGTKTVYTVLGEWDNDLEKGILSNKTKLAANMLGKKAGDAFDLPDAEGNVTKATIEAVMPLSDEIRAWIAADVAPRA